MARIFGDAKNIENPVQPNITANYSMESGGFCIEVELAGADKETVELEVGTYGLSVKAEGDGVQYHGDFSSGYTISPEKAG